MPVTVYLSGDFQKSTYGTTNRADSPRGSTARKTRSHLDRRGDARSGRAPTPSVYISGCERAPQKAMEKKIGGTGGRERETSDEHDTERQLLKFSFG